MFWLTEDILISTIFDVFINLGLLQFIGEKLVEKNQYERFYDEDDIKNEQHMNFRREFEVKKKFHVGICLFYTLLFTIIVVSFYFLVFYIGYLFIIPEEIVMVPDFGTKTFWQVVYFIFLFFFYGFILAVLEERFYHKFVLNCISTHWSANF